MTTIYPLSPAPTVRMPAEKQSFSLTINNTQLPFELAPWTTLLDALREYAHLTGTKKGCDHGQCGACTVLVNGKRINACLTLAIMHEDHAIVTIEGLAGTDGTLHPLQQAFMDHDAFQCGYCTPGQLCSAVGLINEGHAKTSDDRATGTPERDRRATGSAAGPGGEPRLAERDRIRELMSGNLCRCGAYPHIVAAIEEVMQLTQTPE